MTLLELDNEILLVDHLIEDHSALFEKTIREVDWDHSMKARKTASFGVPYDYSNMSYEQVEIPGFLEELIPLIASKIGFTPNNCLINYYYEETSSMGFHSDMIDFLDEHTGICIVSLGNPRILRFRNKENKEITRDFVLNPGSLFLMSQEVQKHWDHAVRKSSGPDPERISLTFRRIVKQE